ncbi:glycosyltransferase family 9 protein [Desulfothermus sp.]
MNILIFRLSAIGDIIMASGILPCIKNHYPSANITWVVQQEYKTLLEDSPFIDVVIPIKRKELSILLKSGKIGNFIKECFTTISSIRKRRYNLVLDLQGIWKSGIWSLFSIGKNRIVVDPKEGVGILYKKKILSNPFDKQIGAEYKLVLNALSISNDKYMLGINTQDPPIQLNDRFVVLCPFTTRVQKFWIDDYWKEIVKYIRSRGYKLVVLGGPSDKTLVKKIFSDFSDIVNLVGRLTINQCLGVIKGASAVIGVDTGLTHGSMLLKRPTIAIFGSTCPYLDTGFNNGVVLYEKMWCSPCKRNPTCKGEMDCMKNITPRKVISILENWL